MALAKVSKIELIASEKYKEKILELLQNAGTVEITSQKEDNEEFDRIKKLQETELITANLEFAVNTLSPYAKKKGLFAQPETFSPREVKEKVTEFDFDSIIEKCKKLEEQFTKAKNKKVSLEDELSLLSPWKSLQINLQNIDATEKTTLFIGTIPLPSFQPCKEKIEKLGNLLFMETVHKDEKTAYFYVVFEKEKEKEILKILTENKFQAVEFPQASGTIKDYCESLRTELTEQEKIISSCEEEFTKLAKDLDELKIIFEYYCWELEKLQTERQLEKTQYSFSLKGWIPEKNIPHIQEKLQEVTKEWHLRELQPEKGETPPVVIQNQNFMSPFEAVSRLYGIPKASEIDPTPFLATFFIVFFALALTDAGYGIMMFIMMALVLKFFKLGEGIKRLVRLLMYGGVVTFIMGTFFGGWWGFTVEQVPAWLTYTNEAGEQMFLLQKINPVTSPLTVLILAFILGYIQILFGIGIKMVQNIKAGDKKEAILDNGTWIFMLLGWGVLAAGAAMESAAVSELAKWWLILAAVLLVATQGRDKKGPVLKLLSGVVSLYGLVGYMSDVLSYSRLLALGLATTIIGMTVNILTDLVGGLPFIGWLLMILMFVVGHFANILINTFGAFIHASRLQFVEFFTKFLEGGGRELKPFSKKTKYIFLNNNS